MNITSINTPNYSANTSFKRYCGANKEALLSLSKDELEILAKYTDKLRDSKYVDFKYIQHPDCHSHMSPQLSIRFKPNANIYSYQNVGEHHANGEYKRSGSEWLDCPFYVARERMTDWGNAVCACHSKAGSVGDPSKYYHIKKDNGVEFNDIYKKTLQKHKDDIAVFRHKYHDGLFKQVLLVEAIEKYHREAQKAANIMTHF